ncbi:hypothetical protein PF004_g14008 [Phytophthora fragariae]|uniref:Uncharacterized protein n=1 Tax=Phytophthora fragariae TaxID=53985 RepID=A0A6G0NQF8_9STRA|nr:hypothetical protein PF004_g14008 [Phytophthora fragariae]
MDDATANDTLAHYTRLHVLPVFQVLKSQQGHFYGVHHGEIAIKWYAEGDLDVAHDNCSDHPWYPDVIAHIEYRQGLLAQVKCLNDDDATNSILIGAMERRARLDVVHDRLHLEKLGRDPYDIAILESGLTEEEDRLQALPGMSGLVADSGIGTDDDIQARRAKGGPISPQGKVVLPTLQRILNSINMDPELVFDRSKFRQLKAENYTVIKAWPRQRHAALRQPHFQGGKDDFILLIRWLTTHRAEMQSILRYLPYPEVVANMLPIELLLQWGELEGYEYRWQQSAT